MEPDIGLTAEQRLGVAGILTPLLADEYVLYTKTRKYHWNVVGSRFNDLHKFFEDQYNALSTIVDDLAERIRMVGSPAIGTLVECMEHTRLAEHPGHYPPAQQMIEELLLDHDTVIRQLRNDIDMCDETYRDVGSADFLTAVLEQHEKMSWMLRAFLVQAPPVAS